MALKSNNWKANLILSEKMQLPAMSWQIDCRAACRKLQGNDAPDISIANDRYGAELNEQKS